MLITISEADAVAACRHLKASITPMAGDIDAVKLAYEFQLQLGIDMALNRNPDGLEGPWYLPWGRVLQRIIESFITCQVVGQMAIRAKTSPEDMKTAKSTVVPDFIVLHSSIRNDITPPVSVWRELVIVEIKPSQADKVRRTAFNTAVKQLERQAHHLFSSDANLNVIGIVGVGEYWKWFKYARAPGTPARDSNTSMQKYFLDHPNLVQVILAGPEVRLGTLSSDVAMQQIRGAISDRIL